MVLNFALNYGSRAEIVTAVQEIAEEVAKGEIHAEEIDDELIAKHLMTGFLPKELQDPELMIRTSGEERISNFLLWQIAYSELYLQKRFGLILMVRILKKQSPLIKIETVDSAV